MSPATGTMSDMDINDSTDQDRIHRSQIHDDDLRAHLAEIVEGNRAVAEARAAAEAARERLQAARDAAHGRLADLAGEYHSTGERPFSEVELRELYWRWPEVHVARIAATMGVHTSDVHKILGRDVPVRCVDCGTEFSVRPGSRATPVASTGVCDACRERRDDHSARWMAELRRRNEAMAEAVSAGDYWLDAYGDIVWRDETPFMNCGCGETRLAPTNFVQAFDTGNPIHFDCQQCGERRSIVLTRYVPPVEPEP